jgi:serine/threonine protein kinase
MRAGARLAAPERGPTRDAVRRAGGTVGNELRLGARLGGGAAAQVWRARARSGEPVAVKLLRPEWRGRPGARELIRREHALLSRLRHPHVVAVRDLIDDDESTGLVYEFLGGGDLVSLAGAPPRHWLGAARDILSALAYVHAHGVVHRDLKARHVMFDAAGRARLIDFGSAAPLGRPATPAGTTAAHRRQAAASVTSADDDAYAFAVLAYELATGRLPFGPAPTAADLAAGPAPWTCAEGGAALAELGQRVSDALSPAPRRRIGSIRDFMNVIDSVIARGAD